MTLSELQWDALIDSAEQSGDLGRKAAFAIASMSVLAVAIESKDIIIAMDRCAIEWESIGAQYGGGSGGTRYLRDLCFSLDRGSERVGLRGLWNLDLRNRGVVLAALMKYLAVGA